LRDEKCHAGSAGHTHTKSLHKNASVKADLGVAYNQLNTDQQRIVDKVFNAVCHQHKALCLVVRGQSGTGKSRVIDYLNRKITQYLSQVSIPVVVAAPTGLAAFNY